MSPIRWRGACSPDRSCASCKVEPRCSGPASRRRSSGNSRASVPKRPATSSDTAVARGASTGIPARWLAWWPLGFQAVAAGSATITVRDSAGRYPPKLVIVRFGLDSSLHVVVDDGYEYGPAATGQRFEDTRFLLLHPYLPSPPLVYLSTTEPGVLRLPDSVLAQGSGHTYFAAAGGAIPAPTRTC